ncbi:MerR family transcriptional regulator [Limosilactobacillus equigenerosi]|uniref:HTH merR-type domain-containing protein n=1 Tax=Limosilactobacillus equigenerosi DSM 18793 = JCM 14505 TaxID=1423742 RepID=A0A0R1UQ92_9LACO|nr:MerR family transcriptional regulator [Limosilactobacillus equigenerosi]KRL95278.1 hypothetical protein FC21_GL000866 [Limosilactobacillus equigenerosi DSM 18793 = JCM 14505]
MLAPGNKRISTVAKEYCLAASTLRFYEDQGLLPTLKRLNGTRIFDADALQALEDIECLKLVGMSIADIRDFMNLKRAGDATLSQRQQMLSNQRQHLEDQIEELKQSLVKLKHKEWYYQEAAKAGSEDIFSDDCTTEYYRAHPDEQK